MNTACGSLTNDRNASLLRLSHLILRFQLSLVHMYVSCLWCFLRFWNRVWMG